MECVGIVVAGLYYLKKKITDIPEILSVRGQP